MYGTEIPVAHDICRAVCAESDEILEKKYFQELLNFSGHFISPLLSCAWNTRDAAVVAKYCDGAIIVIGQGMASARMIQCI